MPNPFTTNTSPDIRWWENPERPCRDRPEYADTSLVTGKGRSQVIQAMAESCRYCPVLLQCRTELLAVGGKPPVSQVRAGLVFK